MSKTIYLYSNILINNYHVILDEFNLICYISMYAKLLMIFNNIQENPSNLFENYVLIIKLILSLVDINIILCTIVKRYTNKLYYLDKYILLGLPLNYLTLDDILHVNFKLLRVNSCRYHWKVIFCINIHFYHLDDDDNNGRNRLSFIDMHE